MSDPRTQEHEAAAEKLAREIVRALVFVPDRKDGEPRVVLPPITALIAAALADAVRVAREEDYKAVCGPCREGWKAFENGGGWWHEGGLLIPQPRFCDASNIHALRSRVGDAAVTAKLRERAEAEDRQDVTIPRIPQDPIASERALAVCDWCAGGNRSLPVQRHGVTAFIHYTGGGEEIVCRASEIKKLEEGDATPGPEPAPMPICQQCGDREETPVHNKGMLYGHRFVPWATPPKKGTER